MNNNENFNSASFYPVTSSFLKSFTFGTLTLGTDELNAVLVDFLAGTQYLYVGLSNKAVAALQDACRMNAENPGLFRVSHAFHAYLQPYQVYSRLNKSI